MTRGLIKQLVNPLFFRDMARDMARDLYTLID